ncbi:thioredoxin domain-containing protein [Agromyces sp. SYSU T00266]|uniref:thioredoxin domain-containing protein n=1 Tax=Agromyces zhanjiangensis TaxID=3158562 RepID=UPI003394C2B2
MKTLATHVAAAAVVAMALAAGVTPAVAADGVPEMILFDDPYYSAPVGEEFAGPIRAVVTDDAGQPVVGVEVTLSVVPDTWQGATVALDTYSAITGADGAIVVHATAGDIGGRAVLRADVGDDVRTGAWMIVRPPGFRPGEQLAGIDAEGEDGARHNLRDTVQKGTYTIVDVCAAWCGPCRFYAPMLRDASAKLATDYKVDLAIVTVLQQGANAGEPSTRSDAVAWEESLGLTNTVLHAEGDSDSDLARAAEFFLLDDDAGVGQAVPTSLLIGPDGTILDRVVGAQASVEEIIQRVLDSGAKAHRPKAPKPDKSLTGERVTATLDGDSASVVFDPSGTQQYEQTPLGILGHRSDDTDPSIAVRNFSFYEPSGLPSSGELTLSLERLDPKHAKEPLTSTTLYVWVTGLLTPGDFDRQAGAWVELPATSVKGVTTVDIDLAALRIPYEQALRSGEYEDYGTIGELTDADIDALVANIAGVEVEAVFARK